MANGRKAADTLAREYELGGTKNDFYDYIIDSLINGQRQQVKDLFNEMNLYYKQDFLINFIDNSIGFHVSARNICISEMK